MLGDFDQDDLLAVLDSFDYPDGTEPFGSDDEPVGDSEECGE